MHVLLSLNAEPWYAVSMSEQNSSKDCCFAKTQSMTMQDSCFWPIKGMFAIRDLCLSVDDFTAEVCGVDGTCCSSHTGSV